MREYCSIACVGCLFPKFYLLRYAQKIQGLRIVIILVFFLPFAPIAKFLQICLTGINQTTPEKEKQFKGDLSCFLYRPCLHNYTTIQQTNRQQL